MSAGVTRENGMVDKKLHSGDVLMFFALMAVIVGAACVFTLILYSFT